MSTTTKPSATERLTIEQALAERKRSTKGRTPKTPYAESEAGIQAALKTLLEALGYICLEVSKARSAKAAGLYIGTTPGTPDMFISHRDWPFGLWLGIEMKKPGGAIRPEQKALAEQRRVSICYSVADGVAAVFGREAEFTGAKALRRKNRLFDVYDQVRDKANPRAEVLVETVEEGA